MTLLKSFVALLSLAGAGAAPHAAATPAGSVVAGSAAARGSGQATPTADRIVTAVQKFYQQTPHLSAKFRQTTVNATFGIPKQNDGRVYLKRPGKMRWDYVSKRDPNQIAKSELSDGKTIWVVFNTSKQYYTQSLEGSALPVAVTFLTGKGDLRKEFDAGIERSGKYGAPGDYVLVLKPKKPSAQFKELYLVVDPSNYRVKESIVVNAAGDLNKFQFFEPNMKKAIPDTLFVFNPRAVRGFRQIKPQEGRQP